MNVNSRLALSGRVLLCVISFWVSSVGGALAQSHRGFYVFGHEVRTFQPCGSDRIYWVMAEAELSEHLRQKHQQLTAKPYEAVYVEVTGHFTEKAKAGLAADYEGQIVIESVDLVQARQQDDCSGAAVGEDGITGIVWKWQQTRLGNSEYKIPDDPARYTIAFQPDGSLAIRADCNRVGGNYTLKGASLKIETTFSTRAICPPDSLDQTFLKHLNAAAIHFMREGALFIDLQADAGTMKFLK